MKMAKTSLILTTTDILGRKQQKSFTDVNPNADTAALKTFAQMCNNLTTNTYVSTDRIDKINCDTEAGTSKTTPTFTASKTTFSKALAGDGVNTDNGMIINDGWSVKTTVTYNGDGAIYGVPYQTVSSNVVVSWSSSNTWEVTVRIGEINSVTLPQTITIHTTETDTYKAATPITLTLTA